MSTPAPALSYGADGLTEVLPAVARSLGVEQPRDVDAPGDAGALGNGLSLPEARRAVVVLIDGLGLELLRRRSGHAPYLRSLLPTATELTCGFPSTTATSMGTFGTGLPPGTHGLVGLQVMVPGEDRLLNELSWENGPDPLGWQPAAPVFQRAEAEGVAVTSVGPGYFDGSGLTRAALRGGRFAAAQGLEARVDASLAALRAGPRTLVYLYWGDLDKTGHVHGSQSWQWGDELERIDTALRRLARSLPPDTSLTLTADHGMVDCPHQDRVDLAHDRQLSAGVRHVGGEPRSLQLHCEPGAANDVLATWTERLGERSWVVTRSEAIALGWFGPVADHVAGRIGQVIAAMRGDFAVVDSGRMRPELVSLLGQHGSLTRDELAVPLIHVPAAVLA